MIDDIRAAFAALYSAATPAELGVVPVRNVVGTYAAIDSSRRAHILFALESDATPSKPSPVAALDLRVRVLSVAGSSTTAYLDITCLFESMADVFEHFCAALIEELRKGSTPTEALTSVLELWKEFLVPAESPVSVRKLAPILGELLVLIDIVGADPTRRLDSWTGPTRARHDFRRASSALEVKTTMSHTSSRVTIHGIDQLEPPADGDLYLHLVRLEVVPDGGTTLPTAVDELLSAGVKAFELYKALTSTGLPPAAIGDTASISFAVRERVTFPVNAHMPRLTPSSLVGGEAPPGVIDISYVIDLDHVTGQRLSHSEYQQVINRFAGAKLS